jgi:hypothetical protein
MGDLLRGIARLFPQLYNATGQPGLAVRDSVLTGITLVAGALALWLAPPELGALAVAWVWLLTYPITLWAHFRRVRSCAPITAAATAAALAGPVFGVLLLSLVLGLLSLIRPVLSAPVVMLALLVGAGAATYVVYLRRALGIAPGDLLPPAPDGGRVPTPAWRRARRWRLPAGGRPARRCLRHDSPATAAPGRGSSLARSGRGPPQRQLPRRHRR